MSARLKNLKFLQFSEPALCRVRLRGLIGRLLVLSLSSGTLCLSLEERDDSLAPALHRLWPREPRDPRRRGGQMAAEFKSVSSASSDVLQQMNVHMLLPPTVKHEGWHGAGLPARVAWSVRLFSLRRAAEAGGDWWAEKKTQIVSLESTCPHVLHLQASCWTSQHPLLWNTNKQTFPPQDGEISGALREQL